MTNTFYIIQHTHWEGAVFITREAYLAIGLPHILQALALLKRFPDYRYTLDQACYVQPFLERYPEEAAAFRQFVAEGRLAIVGGTDVMLDVNMPGGESFVRQVLYGKGYFRRALGVEVTTGWQLDTFGHHAQMPQLLRQAGYDSFWFARGVPARETPAEFHWEGLDGTRILAFWLPHSYGLTYDSPKTLPEFTDFMTGRWAMLDAYEAGPERVGLAGFDVCAPEAHLAPLAAAFNAQAEAPFQLRLATPDMYAAAVAARGEQPVLRGELNPIFQGIYSSRIELKQQTRELETLLLNAEKLGVVLRTLGQPVDDANVWRAWEPMLFNQAHDLMSGVMTDIVHEDTQQGFACSRRLGVEAVEERLRDLSATLDTRGDGVPLLVVNTLGAPRTDLATAEVGFSDGVRGVRLLGPDGVEVPVQLLSATHAEDGTLLRAEIAFLATVPAMGWAVYRALPGEESSVTTESATDAVLENAFYRLICGAGGAISSLRVKDGDWEALRAPGNVVAREADHGDLWELYRPLDAGSNVGMTARHPVPDDALLSTAGAGAGTVTRGPVFSEFSVAQPFGEAGQFSTRIRLYAGLRRIDIRTTLRNDVPSVRYRVLFPTTLRPETAVHEIPFGAITRPDGIEYPAQNWVDCGDGERGVALLNRGLPGNTVADGVLLLSLLRAATIVAYGYIGGYEPGMSSDTGLEIGNPLTFDYALVPHAGDWVAAEVYRDGLAFNTPLLARTAVAHAGAMPVRGGLLQVEPANIVLTTLKEGPDGTAIVRVYEAAGTPTAATITSTMPILAAEDVNLMEDPGAALAVDGGTVRLTLGAFAIKTVKIRLGR